MSNPSLGAGDVNLMLDGEMVTLRPTLRAAQTISRQAGGIVAAMQAVGRFELDTITQVVALGLNKVKPGDLPEVAEKVYRTGLTDVVPAVTTFLTNLANGGRPAATSESENPQTAPSA